MSTRCEQCGKPLKHTEGRKKKKFCDTVCRNAFTNKKNKGNFKTVSLKKWNELNKELSDLRGLVFGLGGQSPKKASSGISQKEFEDEYLNEPSDDASAVPVTLADTHEIGPIKITVAKKNYNEILQAAKGGASKAEIDILIAANGRLNAAQKTMVYSKNK